MPRRALTVSELTAACVPPDEETRSLWLRRLRDWSSIGILPAARQHEGTGRHRLFSRDAIYATAVLLRLADLGIPIGNLRSVARLINAPRRRAAEQEFRRFWREAEMLPHAVDAYYLAITPKRGEPGITFYRQVQGRMILDNDDAWAVINLTQLFRKLSQ
jgi:DNA-binding transcriptional MerR regulator